MTTATQNTVSLTAEDFIAGAGPEAFHVVAERLRKFRHYPRYEVLIRQALSRQSPEVVARLIRAAIWHKDGASAGTGYIPSDYEDILRRDLLLAVRCLADCLELESTLEQALVDEIRNSLLRSNRHRAVYTLIECTRNTLPLLAHSRFGQALQAMLMGVLSDRTATILVERMDAARALGYTALPSSEVVSLLLSIIRNRREEAFVREFSTEALGKLQASTPEVITTLIAILTGQRQNHHVRLACATALGEFGMATPEIVDALASVVSNPKGNEWVVYQAAIALRVLKSVPLSLVELYVSILARYREKLPERHRAPDILRHLGVGTPEVISMLITVLSDEQERPSLRGAAARALGELGTATPEIIAALIQGMRDQNQHYEPRNWATSALAKIIAASSDPQWRMEEICSDWQVEAPSKARLWMDLVRCGVPILEASTSLRERLRQRNDNLGGLRAAALMLGMFRDSRTETISVLHSIVTDNSEDWDLRFYAAAALHDIGETDSDIISMFVTELTGGSAGYHDNEAWTRLNEFAIRQTEPEEMTAQQE